MKETADNSHAGHVLPPPKQRVEELATDIGQVLHAVTAILFMNQQSVDLAVRALGPNPFHDTASPSVDESDQALAKPVQATVRALDRLLETLSTPERSELLSQEYRQLLTNDRAILADVVGRLPVPESRISALRTIACRIQDMLEGLPTKRVPKVPIKNLRAAAREVERQVVIASLLHTRSAILQMDYTVRSLREFVTTNIRPDERATRLVVAEIIEEAHRQLIEYANSSNVELRPRDQTGGAQVIGIERELVRAFANLLHNAVKYSWHRDGSQPPWVSVRTYRQGRMVHVDIESWGVPISPTEIEEGMVFELGYRGKWSTDRGRLGTGIGLTDARDIVERHRGSIDLASRPARSWGPDDPEDVEFYRQPFITTVSLRLPEAV